MAERQPINEQFPRKIVVPAAIAETKRTLAKEFGADTSRILGYRFEPEPLFTERARLNFAKGNKIARGLIDRGLPLVTLFDELNTVYFTEVTSVGTYHVLSLDKLRPILSFTDATEDREIASLATIQFFRYVTKGYLGDLPKEIVLTKDPKAIAYYTDQLFTALNAMAATSERRAELEEFFEELKAEMEQSNEVAIVGKGLEMDMKLKGSTVLYISRPYQMAVMDIMTEAALPTFIRFMENKHRWFLSPDRWDKLPSERPLDDHFREVLEEATAFLEELGLLNNSALLIERFRTSMLSAQIGIDLMEEHVGKKIETEAKFDEEQTEDTETFKESSTKAKEKKKKKNTATLPSTKQTKRVKKELTITAEVPSFLDTVVAEAISQTPSTQETTENLRPRRFKELINMALQIVQDMAPSANVPSSESFELLDKSIKEGTLSDSETDSSLNYFTMGTPEKIYILSDAIDLLSDKDIDIRALAEFELARAISEAVVRYSVTPRHFYPPYDGNLINVITLAIREGKFKTPDSGYTSTKSTDVLRETLKRVVLDEQSQIILEGGQVKFRSVLEGEEGATIDFEMVNLGEMLDNQLVGFLTDEVTQRMFEYMVESYPPKLRNDATRRFRMYQREARISVDKKQEIEDFAKTLSLETPEEILSAYTTSAIPLLHLENSNLAYPV